MSSDSVLTLFTNSKRRRVDGLYGNEPRPPELLSCMEDIIPGFRAHD